MEDAVMGDEPVIADAALLDANMDANMDDLFGEAAGDLVADSLGVPLPSAPLPPSLVMAIAQMQDRGCCTRLTWSNTGSIAYISDGGRKISFQALIHNPGTGDWSLTGESKHPILAPDGATWEHIQFNGVGIELAAADSQGSVYMYNLTGALGKMPPAHTNINRNDASKGDLDAVVGLHWLPVFPTEITVPYITPATKLGERWITSMKTKDRNDPSFRHPVDGGSALLYVSRDAKLTLMYQMEKYWHSTSTRLEVVNASDELLSHAAMGEDGSQMLLVTHDIAKRFRLYKISIAWNQAQKPRGEGLPPVNHLAPTLELSHLTVLDHVNVQNPNTENARLSSLRLVPAIPPAAADANIPTFPTIVALFTRASLPADAAQHQDAFSIIARWHIESVTPSLHEAFSKLKTNGAANTPQSAVTTLRRQEDVAMSNRLYLSIEPQYFQTILAFPAADGIVDFYDRATMVLIQPSVDSMVVSGLTQSGFEHIMGDYNTHVAMSADGSGLICIRPDGTVYHKMMTLRYGWQTDHDEFSTGLIEAAVVCLARQYAILCTSSRANDETLALLPLDLSTEMRCLFVKEILKMMSRNLDISMQDNNRQQMMAIREPLVPKAISGLFVLGVNPGTTKKNKTGKFAFAFLNMKLLATALAQLMSTRDGFNSVTTLASLGGLVRWGSDMLIYIADAVLRFKYDSTSGITPSKAITDFAIEHDSPVVQLLLFTYSRVFLRFIATLIPKFLAGVQRALTIVRSVAERQQLVEMLEMGTAMPFKYAIFEAFITSLDTGVRNAYAQGAVSADRRSEIELSVMCDPTIPTELDPAVQTLIETSIPKLKESADVGKIYFWDTSWLGVEPSAQARQYDVVRKIPLTKGMRLRVCRRCGALMEDVSPEQLKESAAWFMHAHRYCVCANYWILD